MHEYDAALKVLLQATAASMLRRLDPRSDKAFTKDATRCLGGFWKKRFRTIPAWVESRLANLPAAELDALAVRVLDATHLEELFQ